ncbi:MAG: aspartate-semialdehyde dehydrogenase [Anaerolineae bacterium]|jgi:aspartate-semialdehyde dehydrogenase
MAKISVGVLGATGTVGQRFIQLLADHPWFEVTAVAASGRSAGQPYAEACHWLLPSTIPAEVADLTVQPIEPPLDCQLVFSALPSSVAEPVEKEFARAGYAVCTNAAPHRMSKDVPLLIPEVNADHTRLIESQRRQRGWKGLITASANCSGTQLALALKPLHEAFGLRKVSVVTMQAISGAGYPGIPASDILENVVPYIGNEEDKVETEPLKMLGRVGGDRITEASFIIGAQCNRVPVRDGHTECISFATEQEPSVEEVIDALEGFRAPAEIAGLPSSPELPIVVRREPDRPQPVRDRNAGRGMSVVVGRVRPCPILGYKLVLLGHNTVRGAAGGAIHNAELLAAQGWLGSVGS